MKCYNCEKKIDETDAITVFEEGKEHLVCAECADHCYEKCDECGDIVPPDYLTQTEKGNHVCRTCRDENYIQCDSCGEWCLYDDTIEVQEGEQVCGSCLDHYYAKCSICGDYVSEDNITIVVNSDNSRKQVCPYCLTDNYTQCSSCGDWYETVGGELNDNGTCIYCEEATNMTLFPYHSQRGREDKSGGSRYKIGFEIEKEDAEINDLTHGDVVKLLKDTGWVLERDSSLDNRTGFELISPILPLELSTLRTEFESVRWMIEAHDSSHCGGHIHISDAKRLPQEILRDIRGYLPLLYSMYPNRVNNSYCKAELFDKYLSRPDNSHYLAFNVSPSTLEIRLFPSPNSKKTLLFRAKLIKHMLTHKATTKEVIDQIKEHRGVYNVLKEVYGDDGLKGKIKLIQMYAGQYDTGVTDETIRQAMEQKENVLDANEEGGIEDIL